MGYRKRSIEYTLDFINQAGFELNGLKMLELGNQLIWDEEGYEGFFVAKDYFQSLGVDHTSIDLNGKNGALNIDLNKPIKGLGEFDVVTNLGTTEHVKNQKECFNNIHRLCRVGGIMIHLVPHVGSTHGDHQYTVEFFEALAEDRNYKILHLERNGKYEWMENENRIYIVYEKE